MKRIGPARLAIENADIPVSLVIVDTKALRVLNDAAAPVRCRMPDRRLSTAYGCRQQGCEKDREAGASFVAEHNDVASKLQINLPLIVIFILSLAPILR